MSGRQSDPRLPPSKRRASTGTVVAVESGIAPGWGYGRIRVMRWWRNTGLMRRAGIVRALQRLDDRFMAMPFAKKGPRIIFSVCQGPD